MASPTMAGLLAIWGFLGARVRLERSAEGTPDVPVGVGLGAGPEPRSAAGGSG